MDMNGVIAKPAAAGDKPARAKGGSFVKGAFILAFCGFIGRFLGAIYRIPLTNILGAKGMGLYQMIFPMYSLMISVSSSGATVALSNLIAAKLAKNKDGEAGNLWLSTMITLIILGALSAVLLALFSGVIAGIQGNSLARLAYIGIAPGLLFVAAGSGLRGYFQGRQNMVPGSVSQIVEQAVKIGAGIGLSIWLMPRGLEYAALGAALGVSVSELACTLAMFMHYAFSKKKLPLERKAFRFSKDVKAVYAMSVPIMLGSMIMPLTHLFDSGLVLNILQRIGYNKADATALFGLAGGPVGSLVNMPAVLSMAIATAILPSISASRARSDAESVKKKSTLALQLTMLTTLPCAVLIGVFSTELITLLYGRGLSSSGAINEIAIASDLLRISAASLVLVAFIQVTTAILHSMNKNFLPVRNLLAGAIVKIALNVALLYVVGIYATAISMAACYLVTLVMDFISMQRHVKARYNLWQFLFAPLLAAAFMGLLGYFANGALSFFMPKTAAFLTAAFVSLFSYVVLLIVLRAFDEKEMKAIPGIGRFFK